MSNQPTTEHNGYKVVFDEFSNKWDCHALNLSHESLKRLKEKINAWDLQTRKVPNIEAMLFRYNDAASVVHITAIADAKNVWVKHAKGKGRERSKESAQQLAHNTVQNNATVTKAQAMFKQAAAIQNDANALLLAIPRITVEELREIAGAALDEPSEVANG